MKVTGLMGSCIISCLQYVHTIFLLFDLDFIIIYTSRITNSRIKEYTNTYPGSLSYSENIDKPITTTSTYISHFTINNHFFIFLLILYHLFVFPYGIVRLCYWILDNLGYDTLVPHIVYICLDSQFPFIPDLLVGP